jgi:hypothetical protein
MRLPPFYISEQFLVVTEDERNGLVWVVAILIDCVVIDTV